MPAASLLARSLREAGRAGVGAWRSAERAADPRRAAVLLETLGRLLRGCLGAVQGWGRGAELQGSVPPTSPGGEAHQRQELLPKSG